MPVDHGCFLRLLKVFGYTKADLAGQCFGIAAMAMQAFLANEVDKFNKRVAILSRLSQLTDEKIQALKNHHKMGDLITLPKKSEKSAEQQIYLWEIYAFLDGMQLYQEPEEYLRS